MKDLTILIHSCEKFSDLWSIQFEFLKQNFLPFDSIDVILLTDTNRKKIEFNNVRIIEAGEGSEITDRLSFALKYIKTNYVFITLDDYLLIEKVDFDRFAKILSHVKENNVDYLRFYPKPRIKKDYNAAHSSFDLKLYNFDSTKMYAINMYPSLWSKKFIISTLDGVRKNAWEYEVFLTYYANHNKVKCLASDISDFVILDSVRKGKFLRKAWNFIKKQDCYCGNRKVHSFWFEFKLNVRTIISENSPSFFKKILKKIGNLFGNSYYSDYINNYEKQRNK